MYNKEREKEFDFYWNEIFDGLPWNPIEFSVYRFDQSFSLPQKFNKLYEMFKHLAINNQQVMDYMKEFVETFDYKLETTVIDVLNVWLDDGKLADIMLQINELYKQHIIDFEDYKQMIADSLTDLTNDINKVGDDLTQMGEDMKKMETDLLDEIEVVNQLVLKYPPMKWEEGMELKLEIPYFNVHRYGLIDDGVTDNTLKLQTLINKAPDRSEIFFPIYTKNGHYVVSDTIHINHPLDLRGETKDCMIYFNFISGKKDGIRITHDFVNIYDLRLTTEVNQGLSGIFYHNTLKDIAYTQFMNLTIDGFENGIYLKKCFYVTIDNCLIRDSNIGVLAESCTTTLNIVKTYVLRTGTGYKLTDCLYGNINTGACDHASMHAYHFINCKSFNVLSSGSEIVEKTHMLITSCKGLTVDSYVCVNTKSASDFPSCITVTNNSNIVLNGVIELQANNTTGYSISCDQTSVVSTNGSKVQRSFEPQGFIVGNIETLNGHLIFNGLTRSFFGSEPDKKSLYKIGDRYINKNVSANKPIGVWVCVDNTSGNTQWRVAESTVFDHQSTSTLPILTPYICHGVVASVLEKDFYQFISSGWEKAYSLS